MCDGLYGVFHQHGIIDLESSRKVGKSGTFVMDIGSVSDRDTFVFDVLTRIDRPSRIVDNYTLADGFIQGTEPLGILHDHGNREYATP